MRKLSLVICYIISLTSCGERILIDEYVIKNDTKYVVNISAYSQGNPQNITIPSKSEYKVLRKKGFKVEIPSVFNSYVDSVYLNYDNSIFIKQRCLPKGLGFCPFSDNIAFLNNYIIEKRGVRKEEKRYTFIIDRILKNN